VQLAKAERLHRPQAKLDLWSKSWLSGIEGFNRKMTGQNISAPKAQTQGASTPVGTSTTPAVADSRPSDFIRDIVARHVAEGKYPQIHTRFPPEPNGYLHIGHAKSICLNFGIAREFIGICNLRMDDTNPTKEEVEYVDSIIEDVKWLLSGWAEDRLGFKSQGTPPAVQAGSGQPDFYLAPCVPRPGAIGGLEPFFASDYFDQIYEYALRLVKKGAAYVDDLSAEDTDKYRGAPDRPGQESPFRNRSVEENLDLLTRMKNGEFPDGARTLRAKIDMSSPNIWMRDPVLYRIRHAEHHHTGRKWCIYPMYDFAHCLSDYIEGITHSICTLEFEVHRPLYDWILENLGLPRPLPRQYEFAKLIPSYMIVSKRKLIQLVNEKVVSGWDDPRMPTISGLRRRGVTPEALRDFAYNIGVTKYVSITDIAVFEHAIREDLNQRSLRRLAVLRPIKIVISNYPEGKVEELDAVNNPEDPGAGTRKIPFGRELYIERDDFMEDPPAKFFRLRPGGEVRLKYAYIIKCDEVVKDAMGNITELRCSADLDSKTGGHTANRKVKGTIHWVSAAHAVDIEVRLYDRLFNVPQPEADGDFKAHLNPHSLEIITAKCEPSLGEAKPELRYQFERLAYFALDKESSAGKPIFNRTITLKDAWAKEARAGRS
jgi:glutaminyl-tRNA synthetase